MPNIYTIDDLDIIDEPKKKKKNKSPNIYTIDDLDIIDEPKDYDVGEGEAVVRGLGQAAFGLGDEATGAFYALKDKLSGKKGNLKDLYKKYRDIEREKLKQSYEKHPYATYGAEIGASLIPGLGLAGAVSKASKLGKLGKLGALAAGGATEGGITGYGKSEAEDIEGDLKEVLKGAALGGVTSPAMSIVGKGARIAKGAAGTKFGKISGLLGKDADDVVEAYVKDPKKFKELENKQISDVVDSVFGDQRGLIKAQLEKESEKAFEVLKPFKFKQDAVLKAYDDVIQEVKKRTGGFVKETSIEHKIIESLEKEKQAIVKEAKKFGGRVPAEAIKRDVINIVSTNPKAYDKASDFKNYALVANTNLAKKLREGLEPLTGYKEAMEGTRSSGKLQGWAADKLGSPSKTHTFLTRMVKKGKGKSTDKTPSDTDKAMFKRIQEKVGGDALEDIRGMDLHDQLKAGPQHAAKIIKNAIRGAAVVAGGTAGLSSGGIIATIITSLTMAGAELVGGYIEKHGLKKAKAILEEAAKRHGKKIGLNNQPRLSRMGMKYALQKMKEDE